MSPGPRRQTGVCRGGSLRLHASDVRGVVLQIDASALGARAQLEASPGRLLEARVGLGSFLGNKADRPNAFDLTTLATSSYDQNRRAGRPSRLENDPTIPR